MDVVQGPPVLDPGHDQGPDPAVVLAPVQGVVAAPEAAVVEAAAPNLGLIRNRNQSPNQNLLNAVTLAPSQNQETAQSRNLSQSPYPDLVLGPRLRGQSPGRSRSPKRSRHQRRGRAENVQGETGRDLGR